MPRPKKILLMITDAGGGHRASAQALQASCARHAPELQLDIVNMYKGPWAKAEPLGRWTGVYAEDLYNFVLKHSLLSLTSAMRHGARLASFLPNETAERDGKAWLAAEKPDLCVSLMPFANDLHARTCAKAGVPFALVMTDLVDREPFIWYTPEAMYHALWVSAPCQQAAEQARRAGAGKVLECGLLLHPKYLDPALRQMNRAQARRILGLHEDRLTVMVSMGGYGSSTMKQLILGLDKVGRDWQIIAICGRNLALQKELSRTPFKRHQVVPVGFTQQLELYLRAADLMVGKPGPASIFEAIAAGTPLILDVAKAMPQERPNAQWVALHGMGLSVQERRDLPAAVEQLAASPSARASLQAAQAAFPLPNAGKALAEAFSKML